MPEASEAATRRKEKSGVQVSENLPSSPLLSIVQRAAQRNIQNGPAAKAKQAAHERDLLIAQRMQRARKGVKVLVCDDSGSMSDFVASKTKWEHMKLAVDDCLNTYPGIRILWFASRTGEVKSASEIPPPHGGTDLCAGLEHAAKFKPERTIVVSDGYPDDRRRALDAAARMTGRIDIVYCGNDGDSEAIDFMQELARSTGGTSVTWQDGVASLEGAVRKMLMIEAPGAIAL